jgi:hypothetical protein
LHGNETEGDELVEEHIRCTWSQENNEVTLDVRPLITRRANLFALVDYTSVVIQPCTRPPKIRLSNEITKPGKYRITAVATAHGVPSVRGAFVFEWKDFQNVWLNVS